MLFLAVLSLFGKQPVKEDAINLVKATVLKMSADPVGTIDRINTKDAEFLVKDLDNLYVFIYDENINMIAHPVKTQNIGKNCRKSNNNILD